MDKDNFAEKIGIPVDIIWGEDSWSDYKILID